CAGAVDGQQFAVWRKHRDALPQSADKLRPRVEPYRDVGSKTNIEQAILNHQRRHAYQRHGVLLRLPMVAGKVEHTDDATVRIDDGRSRTIKKGVLFEIVLAAHDKYWVLFD